MITLVTGGARSGKSGFAESLYSNQDDVVYIATSQVNDSEMENRVKLHKESRPSVWRTFEAYRNLKDAIGEETNYLLDCVTVMTSNIMFEETKELERIDGDMEKRVEDIIFNELKDLVWEIRKNNYNLILVTNEVGSSIVPEHHISRVFRDIQGRVNQRLAHISDSAYLVASGLPVRLK